MHNVRGYQENNYILLLKSHIIKIISIASSAVGNLTANMLALQVLILQTIALTILGMAWGHKHKSSHKHKHHIGNRLFIAKAQFLIICGSGIVLGGAHTDTVTSQVNVPCIILVPLFNWF